MEPESDVIAGRRPRVLVIANTVFFPPFLDELPALHASGEQPRAWINEVDVDMTFLDQRLLTGPSDRRRRLYRRLPFWIVQVLEAFRVGRQYDVVFCWSVANVTLVLAALLRVTSRRIAVVALLTRVSESKKARVLRWVHPGIAKIVLPPVVQREYAVSELGVPAEKLVDLPWTLDTEFWMDDTQTERVTISAAGGEMRDYPTLVRAVGGLDIPCHIAGVLDTERQDWWNADDEDRSGEESVPDNVTFGTMPAVELRDLYRRSRLVVVPLRATDSDNGITCMNEAWSMGRPVIVSAVDGQRDALVDGREGLWVPVGDAEALRSAILELWNDPERAARMGAEGRRLMVEGRDTSVFAAGVTAMLVQVADDARTRSDRRVRS